MIKSIKSKRIAALILALLALMPLSACSERADDANAAQTEAAPVTEAETEPDNLREITADNLPDDLDYDGYSMRVYSRGGDADTKMEFFGEQDGDIVNDVVYTRNLSVEERLNVKIDLNLNTAATRHTDDSAVLRTIISSGSDEYDVFSNAMYGTMPLVLEDMFYNLNSLDYIDFSQPWWNKSCTELASVDGKLYTAAGELSTTMISGCFCTFFNTDLFNASHPGSNPYDDVANGEWTLDRLTEYCRGLYNDINGDGKADQDDFYGLYLRNTETLASDAFTGGVRLSFVESDGDDNYTLTLANERTIEFVEQIRKIAYTDNIACRGTYNDATVMQTMLNGTTVFTPWMLGGVADLRNMEDNYGILPMPMLNERQDGYSTYAHDGFSIFVIPVTSQTPDRSAAFLEAMCAESYRIVTPVYFETALKVKYARDVASAQMLDIITGSVYLDISYLYNQKLSTIVTIFRSLFINEGNCDTLMSTIASKEKSINKALEKIIETYADLN